MRLSLALLPLTALGACFHYKDPVDTAAQAADADTDADTDADSDADSDTDTDADTDTDTGYGTIDLPASTLPISLHLGGAADGLATFDEVVCSHPPNNQFQLTYTDSTNAYTWNMRVFIRETFAGAGVYSTNVQVQLLENFSGGRYFAGSTTDGVAIAVTVEGFGTNGAYGSFTTDALPGDAGDATISPQPIPFWCDAVAE